MLKNYRRQRNKMRRRKFRPAPELGKCHVCEKAESHIRYFVAVPLPEIMYLCQDDYDCLKEEARQFVREFLRWKT